MRLNGLDYLGRFQVGQEIPLLVHCRDRDRVPYFPDRPPTATILAPDGSVVDQVGLCVVDPYRATGVFARSHALGNQYALGKYTVKYAYTVAGEYQGLLLATFEVVGGGDIGGPVISLYAVNRPEAGYVVAHLGTGRLVQGRNPYV